MELDLALDAGSVGLTPHEPSDLLDASGWHSRLHAWIEVVRSDSSLHCPDLVRRAEEVSLGLRFSDDATVRELNATWRQRDQATDVLSFAALDDAPAWLDDTSVELGDIVISLDTARRQALDHGHSLWPQASWLRHWQTGWATLQPTGQILSLLPHGVGDIGRQPIEWNWGLDKKQVVHTTQRNGTGNGLA